MYYFRRLLTVKPAAWALLAAVLVISVLSTAVELSSGTWTVFAQPAMAILVAAAAYYLGGKLPDRVRHKDEKTVIVVSVLAIWFVVYFLSGFVTTYVHNALAANIRTIMLNIVTYGSVAVAIEYVRHRTILIAGPRNAVWFGMVVTIVFALQQMNLASFASLGSAEDLVKEMFVDIVPSIISSTLLTYLALTGGFGSMLAYKLGTLAILLLPPIIPKYDWYLIGTSSVLLAVAVFMVIDRSLQGRQFSRQHYYRHMQHTHDGMLYLVMIGLVLFMTGVFTYKPFAIMSNSMKPTFSRGSMVVVQKINSPLDISVGDIVQYESSGKMITHRVVEIYSSDDSDGLIFITKGDNNPSRDQPVRQSQVIGIIRANIPFVGYPTVWLKEFTK